MIKIFISHSSYDASYAESLVTLLRDIGVNRDQIFCSSIKGCDIHLGGNIIGTIKNEFTDNELYVILLLSENYYNSPTCLAETGAALVRSVTQLAILLPGFSSDRIRGVVDPHNIYVKLDSDERELKDNLTKFKEDIERIFDISNRQSFSDWDATMKRFVESVSQLPPSPILSTDAIIQTCKDNVDPRKIISKKIVMDDYDIILNLEYVIADFSKTLHLDEQIVKKVFDEFILKKIITPYAGVNCSYHVNLELLKGGMGE